MSYSDFGGDNPLYPTAIIIPTEAMLRPDASYQVGEAMGVCAPSKCGSTLRHCQVLEGIYPNISTHVSGSQSHFTRALILADLLGLSIHLPLQSNLGLIFSTICPLAEGPCQTLPCQSCDLHNVS